MTEEELFRKFLFEKHKGTYVLLLMFGHVELLTDELMKEFDEWCKSADK